MEANTFDNPLHRSSTLIHQKKRRMVTLFVIMGALPRVVHQEETRLSWWNSKRAWLIHLQEWRRCRVRFYIDVCYIFSSDTCSASPLSLHSHYDIAGKIPHLRAIACFTIIIGILEKKGLLDNNEMKKDMSKRNWVQQYLATLGTQHLLLSSVSSSSSSSSTLAARLSTVSSSSSSSTTTPHYDMAATIALCLLKVELLEAETSDFTVKMRNIAEGTERDVIRFFAKRITCGCLKKKWRAIKSEPKLGLCIHCESRKKRHELMVCSLCRKPHYCSMKCQHEHWPKRKCLQLFFVYPKCTVAWFLLPQELTLIAPLLNLTEDKNYCESLRRKSNASSSTGNTAATESSSGAEESNDVWELCILLIYLLCSRKRQCFVVVIDCDMVSLS